MSHVPVPVIADMALTTGVASRANANVTIKEVIL
jgi:hypothetical protein